jgi:putative flippase GtrA
MTIPSPFCKSNVGPRKLMRFCKFNFVGGVGVLVQFTALFLLKGVLQVNYLSATAIAVEAAVVHNFIWHDQFTWADRTTLDPVWRRSLLRFLRFNLGNGGISILGNLALMHRLVGELRMNYLLANTIAITLCSLANFLVSDRWVFEQKGSPQFCDLGSKGKE